MANNDIELNLGLSQTSLKKFNKEYKEALKEAAKAGSLLSDAEKKNLQILSEKVKNAKKLTDEYKKQLGILEKQKTATPGRDVGGALKTMGGGLLGGAANIIGSVIGGAVGFAIGGVKAAYEKYLTHQQALGSSIGMFSTAERNRGAYGSGGARYGYNLAEVAKMLPVMGRATGTSNVTELMQANRATGMDIGDVAETFGMLRQAGGKRFTRGAGGSQGAKEFTKLMSLGVQSGVEKARLPEYLAGLNKNVRSAAGLAAGDVNVSGMATELSLWGKISGKSGFQGARGSALFGQVMQGILKPGGGEFGEALMNQAFGFGKPGGTASFYEAQKAREAAASGDVGGVRKVMGEVGTQFGKGQEGALALRELLGVSLQQAEELQKIYDSDQSFEQKEEEMKKIMDGAKSLQEQANEMMGEQSESLQHLADQFDEGAVAGKDFAGFFRALDRSMLQSFKNMKPLIDKVLKDIESFLPSIPELVKKAVPILESIYDVMSDIFKFLFIDSKEDKSRKAFLESTKGIENFEMKPGESPAEALARLEAMKKRASRAIQAAGAMPEAGGWQKAYEGTRYGIGRVLGTISFGAIGTAPWADLSEEQKQRELSYKETPKTVAAIRENTLAASFHKKAAMIEAAKQAGVQGPAQTKLFQNLMNKAKDYGLENVVLDQLVHLQVQKQKEQKDQVGPTVSREDFSGGTGRVTDALERMTKYIDEMTEKVAEAKRAEAMRILELERKQPARAFRR